MTNYAFWQGINLCETCADPESFVRRDPTLTLFFFVVFSGFFSFGGGGGGRGVVLFCFFMRGGKDPNTTFSGPSTAREQYAI